MKKKRIIALFFVVIAFLTRFIPLKLPNIEFISSTISILILFFGLKITLPLILSIVLISDVILTGKLQSWELIVIFGWSAVILTQWHLRGKKLINTFLMQAIGTIAFYLVTNSLVFLAYSFYQRNFSGYITCLLAGIPFVRNQLIFNGIFSFVVYKTYQLFYDTENINIKLQEHGGEPQKPF